MTPDYKNHKIHLEENTLNLLASGDREDNVGFLNSDVKVFRGKFDDNKSFTFKVKEGKGLFLYIPEFNTQMQFFQFSKRDIPVVFFAIIIKSYNIQK